MAVKGDYLLDILWINGASAHMLNKTLLCYLVDK